VRTGRDGRNHPETADELLTAVRNLAANVLWSPNADARTAIQLAERVRQLDHLMTTTDERPEEWKR
jgi:hypothetical protein